MSPALAVRSLFFIFAFYTWSAGLSAVALPALASRKATAKVCSLWARVALGLLRHIVGLTYELRGRDHLADGPVIYAFKHQSAWDTLALWVLLSDPAVVLKDSLARIPVFGWYVRRCGALVVDRSAGAKSLRSMVSGARVARNEGRPIAIFPEGTRTAPGERAAYHPGVAALYSQLELPLIPVALNSGLYWPRRSWLLHPGQIVVEILAPIQPGMARRRALMELEKRIEGGTAVLLREGEDSILRANHPNRTILRTGGTKVASRKRR